MTYVVMSQQATRLNQVTAGASSSGTPVPIPASGTDQDILHATITAAAADYLPLAANTAQSGRLCIFAFSNDSTSTANYTINATGTDLIYGPKATTGTASYVLLPNESLTLTNTAAGKWVAEA